MLDAAWVRSCPVFGPVGALCCVLLKVKVVVLGGKKKRTAEKGAERVIFLPPGNLLSPGNNRPPGNDFIFCVVSRDPWWH